ncbi:hypothetical protein B0J12DRAFT_133150 [Macrophomina phaseolina]|uniref:Uncharacterized protein n=1 Tax=Macrophomina phaseolina TaxID=35725 RepID=A0ABQ8G9M6_9PEZI|nr:hypothetical protein B0J12DRAFT_133150 [Macrophomina phaseolina]
MVPCMNMRFYSLLLTVAERISRGSATLMQWTLECGFEFAATSLMADMELCPHAKLQLYLSEFDACILALIRSVRQQIRQG